MVHERRRLLPTLMAVVLGVAFLAATLMMSATIKSSIVSQTSASVDGADAVVAADASTTVPASAVSQMRARPGVSAVEPAISTTLQRSDRASVIEAHITPALDHGSTLVSGRMPRGAGEVAVNPLAADSGVKIGQKISLSGFSEGAGARRLTVVGVIDPGPRVSPNNDQQVYLDAATLMSLRGEQGYDTMYVTGSGGQDAVTSAIKSVPELAAEGITVRTADQQRQVLADNALAGSSAMTGFMTAFAMIALTVGAIVIVNTFGILVAQRAGSLALARCVGATKAQVRRSVLADALEVGLAGSVIGVAVGAGLAQLVVSVAGNSTNVLLDRWVSVSVASVAIPLAAGTLVTLLAALPPARRATRVPPVAALSPVVAEPTRRVGRARLATGVALFVLGAALLAWAATGADSMAPALLAGITGGLMNFAGVLVLAVVLIPRLARAIGRAAGRIGGMPAELAAENAQRNPGRAAATVSALLVGVTLIVMTAVGAATGQSTIDATLDKQFPFDASVSTGSQPAGPAMVQAIDRTQGVAAAGAVPQAQLSLESSGRSTTVTAQGYGPQVRSAFRDTTPLNGLDDRHALIQAPGVASGDKVTLSTGGRSVTLSAVVPEGADTSLNSATLTTATLTKVAPGAQAHLVLVRYADGTASADVTSALTTALAPYPSANLSSASDQRDQLEQIITIMMVLVIGLLAISVIIALVGVANTLGLSVLERTREIGLLRALGLTRRQIRAMFGHEAVQESVAAIIVGLVLGSAYGIAGAYALLGSEGLAAMHVAIPWLQLAGVTVIALAAGWVASVIPGRRAARISPAVALAGE
ncbi:MAG: FtsX-like permease family protein [Acidipropionibacterium acidipropionici]|jgi:putative ABC transport system permease protein|uniref:ABC transporter permease n=1 Tax=Acidipropionibacterium acidipropionici TaxID=1748 RepID=UPI002F3502B6